MSGPLSYRIRPEEWRWVIGWGLVVASLALLPYLYGAILSTPDHLFGGFMIGVEDGYSYLAKMQEGQAGHWLFYLAYTPEAHPGALFFLFYLLLGKLARLLALEPVTVLLGVRPVTIGFGLWSFYHFVAYFTGDIFIRRLAFLLFGLTAGLGWLWILLGFPIQLGAMPVDLWVPDASFFLSALTFPHLPLAQGLVLWVVIGTLQFLKEGSWWAWGVAAGSGLLVSLIHPYHLPVLSVLFGGYLLWRWFQQRVSFWPGLGRVILMVLPSLPYLVYVLGVFETNFAFKSWRDQSLTWSPPPLHYILGFGLLLGGAGIGLWQRNRFSVSAQISFLGVWLILVPLLLYLPIPLQRRFLDGYQAALAVLAALGLAWVGLELKSLKGPVLVGIFIGMSLTNLLLVGGALFTVRGQQAPIFHSATQRAAFGWLAENAPGQVVLSAYETGNLLPAYAPVRVFVGHGPETIKSAEKEALLLQFFERGHDSFRRQLLQEYQINFVFYGPAERALGNFIPDQAPYLKPVYNKGGIQIYQVQFASGEGAFQKNGQEEIS